MKWTVILHEKFENEFDQLGEEVQDQLLAHALLLEEFGPHLGRPYVDTLKGSKYANIKELRFRVGNDVWRVAFAFDPKRRAILLVAGNKRSINESRFYLELIKIAEERFCRYLNENKLEQ